MNWLSKLLSITSETIHVPSPVRMLHLVNGWTCQFCLTHPLDSLDNPVDVFTCQTCLGYESQGDCIQVCDLKRRQFSSQWRTWSQIFDHINTTFLWVTDYVLFWWRSNCEDCTGKMVGLLFTFTDLNEITNFISKKRNLS